MDHSIRSHATWSASSSARNFACPGALALVQAMNLADKEGQAAAWGTACHQIADVCLNDGSDAAAHIGKRVETKEHVFIFDEEMADCTQVFLDYVRERIEKYEHEREFSHHPDDPAGWNIPKATLLVEQNFDLVSLDPPFDAGGTGDAVLLFPAWGMIEVVDLKTGRGWVDPRGNPQCRTYALGAALANPGAWGTIRSTIVGPRMGGEPVRYEEIDLMDLLDWTTDLKSAWETCGYALEDYPLLDEKRWSEKWLTPGDHCHDTYCPAARTCPALEARAMAIAQTHFAPIDEAAVALEIAPPPDPKTLPVEKIAAILDAADMLTGWLNEVRAYARELVEAGTPVGEYILVDKDGRRQWLYPDDEARVVGEVCDATGLDSDALYERKLKSPNQVETVLRTAPRKKLIEKLWVSKVSGTNLVRRDKTSRPPAVGIEKQFFTPITE